MLNASDTFILLTDIIKTTSVNSNDQLNDVFSKSLWGPQVYYVCNKLDAYDIYAPA